MYSSIALHYGGDTLIDTRAILNHYHDALIMRHDYTIGLLESLQGISLLWLADSQQNSEQIFQAPNTAHNSKVPIININQDILYHIFLSSVIDYKTSAQ
jgi:hypothetical protein